MAVIFAAATTILMTQEHVSARQFTVECLKNQYDEFLCASTAPDAEAAGPDGMTGQSGCAMSCTLDERCRHFNYIGLSSRAMPCQLFYTEPTTFVVVPGCKHYRSPSTGAWENIHSVNAIRTGPSRYAGRQ